MIKLGRIGIITKVSFLSSHNGLPIEGHIEGAIHVMVHIGQRYIYRLVYDPSYPEVDHSALIG